MIQHHTTDRRFGTNADATATATTSPTELATDTLFELLQNQRRRDALGFLRAHDGRATLSELAEHIAAKENDVEIEAINSKQRKRVYIGLYQCHLPKLAKAGVVDFDKNRGTIELRERATQLYPYLDGVDVDEGNEATDNTGPRQRASAVSAESSALAGLGVAALAGVAGVPGFELLPPAVWAVVCALSLLVTAARSVRRD